LCPGGRLEYRSSCQCNLRLPMAVLLGGLSSLTAGTGRCEAHAGRPGALRPRLGKSPCPHGYRGGPHQEPRVFGRWTAPPRGATTSSGTGPLPSRVQGGPLSGTVRPLPGSDSRTYGPSHTAGTGRVRHMPANRRRHDLVWESPPALTGTGGALIRNRASSGGGLPRLGAPRPRLGQAPCPHGYRGGPYQEPRVPFLGPSSGPSHRTQLGGPPP